jgi:hypothetical protein
MPAFIHEKRGGMDSALQIMEQVRQNAKSIPAGELRFMEYFVKERLHKLESDQKKHAETVK